MELLKDQMNRIFIVFVSFLIIGMIYLFSYSLSKPEISRINNQTGKDLPEFENLVVLNPNFYGYTSYLASLFTNHFSICFYRILNPRAFTTKD